MGGADNDGCPFGVISDLVRDSHTGQSCNELETNPSFCEKIVPFTVEKAVTIGVNHPLHALAGLRNLWPNL
jgi:hypothetical protein